MTGTHGTKEGVSALTELETKTVDDDGRPITAELIDHGFYLEDCNMVGIKAGPKRSTQRPPLSFREPFTEWDWKRLPDITKPAEKLDNPSPDSFCNDELMKDMDFRVACVPYYYKNGEKLIREIKEESLNNYHLFKSFHLSLFIKQIPK